MSNRSKSGWEIAQWVRDALTTQWATVVAELETAWGTDELVATISDTDIRLSSLAEYTGEIAISINGTGQEYDPAYITSGGMRPWDYEIAVAFAPSGDADTTTRMIEHYMQVIWICLYDYLQGAGADGTVSCVYETGRMPEVRLPEIDLGTPGGTLSIRVMAQHLFV